jgi:hypothetical protein
MKKYSGINKTITIFCFVFFILYIAQTHQKQNKDDREIAIQTSTAL